MLLARHSTLTLWDSIMQRLGEYKKMGTPTPCRLKSTYGLSAGFTDRNVRSVNPGKGVRLLRVLWICQEQLS